ncbi:MAG: transcription termination/antitermination protein NusA [Erysipelotrichaceae bacterium]|nr:transcription termination/antitermination protein NusA [Erysipelotrichaceae bacterium]
MDFKAIYRAMNQLEDNRKISKEIVVEALKEAMAKAYRKHIDIPDVQVRVDINEKSGEMKLYQLYTVVEEVEDDELEISLEEVKRLGLNLELGQQHEIQKPIDDLGRAAALLAKNVMKQKIREAEKQAVYDEYIDLLDEMVIGLVESVEEKFVVVNLGKTMALMPRAAQIPGEIYREGQNIRVVITECNKETKGAQVLVSRADAKLVKRLFEREVPEIYEGVVEIKAIAREAGERCKMAVYSSDPNVDPIGACIGPRGARVSAIIEELHGEKIDIFEWSENVQELIKNALAPAQVLGVIPSADKKSLLVIVEDNQLSLAIGKKGKNARLAVKLTGKKIDIKTRTDVEESGIDWKMAMIEFAAEQKRQAREKAAAKMMEEMAAKAEEVEETVEEVIETVEEKIETVVEAVEEKVETVVETVIEKVEAVVETVKEAVQPKEDAEEKRVKKPVVKKDTYVSKFEKIFDNKPAQTEAAPKRRKNKQDEDRKLRPAELKKDKDYEFKPIYSEEELEEIKRNEEVDEYEFYDDIDYDEFDEFYDED